MTTFIEVTTEFLKNVAAPLGVATAETLIGFIKRRKNSIGNETAKCMEQNAKKTIEELKNIQITPKMRKEIEQFLREQKRPEYMYGVDFYFAEKISDDDKKELKAVLQHVNPDRKEEMEYDDEDIAEYQKILDDLLNVYVSEYINEDSEDYGIEGDNLYINFQDDPKGNDRDYDQEADEDMSKMVEALNYLLKEYIGSNNKIVKYIVF